MSSRQIEAGGAFVRLYTKDGGLDKGLTKAENRLRMFSRFATKTGGILLGSVAAMGAAFAPAIAAASNLEEQVNKFNVVFGESRDEVRKWSQEFGDAIGRSERQIVEFMGSSQDLFVPLGFAADEATDLSKTITRLSIDLASFNNKSDSDVLNDLQAALTGSGEVMKKYGVILSETAVKQELLNMGLDPKTVDNQAKVQARMNIILRGTTAAQGDAERSAGSYANMKKALAAEIENVSAKLAQDLLPILADLWGDLREVLKATGDWLSKNRELIPVLAKYAAGIGIAGGSLLALGVAANTAAGAIAGLKMVLLSTNKVALAFKTIGIAAVLATIAIQAAKATRAFRDLNTEIDKANGLDTELAEKGRERTEKIVEKAEGLKGEEKESFVKNEIDMLNKNIEGLTGSEREIQDRIKNASKTRKAYDMFGLSADMDADRSMLQGVSTRLRVLKERRKRLQGLGGDEEVSPQEAPQEVKKSLKVPSVLKGLSSAFSPVLSEIADKGKEIQDKAYRDLAGKTGAGLLGQLLPGSGVVSTIGGAIGGISISKKLEQTPEIIQRTSHRLSANQALDAGTGEAQRAIAQALAPRVTVEEKSLKVQEEIRDSSQENGTLLSSLAELLEQNGFTLLATKA